MKSFFNVVLIATALSLTLFSGCKEEEEVVNKHQILAEHLRTTGLDLPTMHATGWVVPATTLHANLAGYYIIDIRTQADFNAGRIQGAVNSTMANVVQTARTAQAAGQLTGREIIVVCYSGQTAGFAVAALRLSGFPTARNLMWGMSSWNSTRDVWTPRIADLTHANIVSPPNFAANVEYTNRPLVTSDSDDPVQILSERVQAVLNEGLRSVDAATVLANPGNYFINNYWTAQAVIDNGNRHIAGAFRILPLTLANNEFRFLDPSRRIVNYCFTGQTSAAAAFYLRVLGYDVYSFSWGANSMWNSSMTANRWPITPNNFPLVQ
ncbi:MAG TPA: rhodanese-like domain-containing protein [Bacteroidales bacterium]|nr:rhodanese-like domain-containing protein [Bacteroidales bacterium]